MSTDLLGGTPRKQRKPVKVIKQSQAKKLFALYLAVNELMAELGAEGQVNAQCETASKVMDALHEVDNGAPITEMDKLP